MTVGLARRLVCDGIVGADDVNAALHAHVTERTAFLEALVRSRPELSARLESELGTAHAGSASVIVADAALAKLLPPGLSAALLVVPVGRDARTGAVRVVAAEPADMHVHAELAYHLGAAVEISGAPLRSILAALAALAAPAPSSPRSSGLPSSPPPIPIEKPRVEPSLEQRLARPSEPPIPLVRLTAEPAAAPATVKGVAPQATGFGRGTQVVVQRRNPVPPTVEPVIELTRTKAVAVASAGAVPASEPSGPVTVAGTGPVQPSTTLVGAGPGPEGAAAPAPGEVATTTPAPADTASPAAAEGEDAAERALAELAQATSAEEVVTAFIRGLAAVAARVLVLAVRGKVFEGRDASDAASREAVRGLVVSGDRPSVLLTATQTGSYLGPIPQTLVHVELGRILEGVGDEIAVGVVTVSGRAALVYVAAGLETAYLATRRGDQLSGAASRALERIVRERKK